MLVRRKKGQIYISFLGIGFFCVFARVAHFRMVGFGNTLCIYYVVATALPLLLQLYCYDYCRRKNCSIHGVVKGSDILGSPDMWMAGPNFESQFESVHYCCCMNFEIFAKRWVLRWTPHFDGGKKFPQ